MGKRLTNIRFHIENMKIRKRKPQLMYEPENPIVRIILLVVKQEDEMPRAMPIAQSRVGISKRMDPS
jgi:hypothetical protein